MLSVLVPSFSFFLHPQCRRHWNPGAGAGAGIAAHSTALYTRPCLQELTTLFSGHGHDVIPPLAALGLQGAPALAPGLQRRRWRPGAGAGVPWSPGAD